MWQITQDEIQELYGPPGKITKLIITTSGQKVEDKNEQQLKFIKLANICYFTQKINKAFDINYIYRINDIRYIVQDLYNAKGQEEMIKTYFDIFMDQHCGQEYSNGLKQPLLLIDKCENLTYKALNILWNSNSPLKIYETILQTKHTQCQLSDELIILILLQRNKFEFLFHEKIIKYLDLASYCVTEQGEIDLSVFKNYFQSLSYSKVVSNAKILITQTYTKPGDVYKAMKQLLTFVVEQEMHQTNSNDAQQDNIQYEQQENAIVNNKCTDIQDVPFTDQLKELTELFANTIYKYLGRQRLTTDYLGYKRQDSDFFFQVFILQLQDYTTMIQNPIQLLDKVSFQHLDTCFITICLLNELLDNSNQVSLVQMFLDDKKININDIGTNYQLLLNFPQIRNTLLKNKDAKIFSDVYQMLYAMNNNKNINQFQLEKLIQLIPLTDAPFYNSNQINNLIINLDYLKYILQQYDEEALENNSQSIITQQLLAIKQLYSSYLSEVTTRMNSHNVKNYYSTIIYYSDLLPVQHADWIIQSLIQTDFSDILFTVVSKNQLLTIKIIITKFLNILNSDMDKFKQKEVQNGVLNKQYQYLCIFMCTLIFQHPQYSSQLAQFFLADIVQSIYTNLRDYKSYLHLYMLREILTHIFYKCSSNEQKNRKLINTIQAQDNAFKVFKDVNATQITQYLQIILGPNESADMSDNEKLEQNLILLKILELLTSSTFINQLSIKNINYEELAELIQLTRNDLLFFFNCTDLSQEFIDQQEKYLKNTSQTTNNILFKAIMQQKSARRFVQSLQLYIIFQDQEVFKQDEKITQHFVTFYSSNKNAAIQEQLFELLLSAPQMYQSNVKQFLLLFIQENGFKLICDFLVYGYMNSIAMTRNDIENFGKLVNDLLEEIRSNVQLNNNSKLEKNAQYKNQQNDGKENYKAQVLYQKQPMRSYYEVMHQKIYLEAYSDPYEIIIVLHSYLCTQLFENTYSDRVLALHKIIQHENAQNIILLSSTNKIFKFTDDIYEDDRSALMKTTLLQLKQYRLQQEQETTIQIKTQAQTYLSELLELNSPYFNILNSYVDKNKIIEIFNFDE